MSQHESATGRDAAVLPAELLALGSEADRAGMARYGINVEHASGVSVRARFAGRGAA